MELTAQEAWSKILESVSTKLPEQTLTTWLAATQALALSDKHLAIGAPSDFAVEWIDSKYGDTLRAATRHLFGADFTLSFECAAPAEDGRDFANLEGTALTEVSLDSATQSRQAAPAQPVVGALNPRYTLANFVVGSNSEFAVAACRGTADDPGITYNPLFIYGGVGLGKTHLMHGIGNAVLERYPDKRVAYLPSEQFTNELIEAIQSRTTSQFHNRYRRIDVLLIDDVHFLAGKERTQEEFFHTFNALYNARKQIVLASDRPPKEISELEGRLVSRFEWGLVTDISPPDFETRLAILEQKAEQDGLAIPRDVLAFVAERCRSSVRELEGALLKLLAYSSLTRQDVTVSLANTIFSGPMGTPSDITSEAINNAVAQAWGVTVAQMRSKSRQRHIAEPRQVAIYLQRELLERAYTQIGHDFGGRDHSTVMHSVQRVRQRLARDPAFRSKVEGVRGQFR